MTKCLYLHKSNITKFDFMNYAFANLLTRSCIAGRPIMELFKWWISSVLHYRYYKKTFRLL